MTLRRRQIGANLDIAGALVGAVVGVLIPPLLIPDPGMAALAQATVGLWVGAVVGQALGLKAAGRFRRRAS